MWGRQAYMPTYLPQSLPPRMPIACCLRAPMLFSKERPRMTQPEIPRPRTVRPEDPGPKSPRAALLANSAIAELPPSEIQITTRARPIVGRAIRPRTPSPPREIEIAAMIASPIARAVRLPRLTLHVASAPLREPQIH